MWTYWCYTSSRGDNEFQEWYLSLDKKGRGKAYDLLEYLKASEDKERWKLPEARPLVNIGKGLFEIRIKYNVQHRIAGYFQDDLKHFVMLCYFVEKSSSDTHRACQKAQIRKQEVESDGSRTQEYDFS